MVAQGDTCEWSRRTNAHFTARSCDAEVAAQRRLPHVLFSTLGARAWAFVEVVGDRGSLLAGSRLQLPGLWGVHTATHSEGEQARPAVLMNVSFPGYRGCASSSKAAQGCTPRNLTTMLAEKLFTCTP